MLNCEDTTRSGRAKPVGPLDPSIVSGGKGEVARRTAYNMSTPVWELNKDMVARMVGICNETSAKLVCCSEGRRNSFELRDHLTETLFNAGLPQDAFLGFVPDLESRVYEDGGPAPGPSQRIEAVRRWLHAQDPRRVIEAWVIVDKLDLIRGDGRTILHEKKAKAERLLRHCSGAQKVALVWQEKRGGCEVGKESRTSSGAGAERNEFARPLCTHSLKTRSHRRTRQRSTETVAFAQAETHDHIGNISCGAQAAV